MKSLKIITALFITIFTTSAFSQLKQDSIEEPTKETRSKTTVVDIEKKSTFGYHHNNYKHHAKAKKAKKWFRSSGHVHQSAKVTNYKMPFTVEHKAEKLKVEETKTPRHARNYKQPYSKN